MSEVGHNSNQTRNLVDRIERLEDERKTLAEDIKEIYAEAKSAGYDCKVLRRLVRENKQDEHEREEQEALLQQYRRDLGPYQDTPLGAAAMERVAARA